MSYIKFILLKLYYIYLDYSYKYNTSEDLLWNA